MKTQSQPNQSIAILLWILVTIVAWTLCPINPFSYVRTYAEIPPLLLMYGISGALLGFLIGVGQYWILHVQGIRAQNWIAITTASYGIGFLVGLSVNLLIPVLVWRWHGESLLPLTQPSNITVTPYMSSIVLGGGVVGIIQWFAVRRILPLYDMKMAALWILGAWLGIGFGVMVGPLPALIILPAKMTGYPPSAILSTLVRSGTGLVSGTITALILFTLIRHAQRISGLIASGAV